MSVKALKSALRKEQRRKRATLSASLSLQPCLEHQILQHTRHLQGHPTLGVALFWSMPGEVPLSGAVDLLLQHDISVLLPRICGPRRLEFVKVAAPVTMGTRQMGVWQPEGPRVPLESVGWLGVPGLAFSPWGERLGMGGGFYDEVIRLVRAQTSVPPVVGLAWDHELLNHRLPVEAHDQRVSAIMTPSVGLLSAHI